MASANLMIVHELNPVKGWPSPYALDKTLQVASLGASASSTPVLSAADNLTYFVSGRVATQVTTSTGGATTSAMVGQLILGTQNHNTGICPMPLFVFPNAKDFDVIGDAGNIVGMNTTTNGVQINFAYTGGGTSPFVQTSLVNTLVATGAYELETTEYNTSSASSLKPGQLLTAIGFTGANQATTAGVLDVATITKEYVVCGVVSDGLIAGDFIDANTGPGAPYSPPNNYRLRFWPLFLPIWSRA